MEHLATILSKELETELKKSWKNFFLPAAFVTEATLTTVFSRLRERTRVQLVSDTLESYRAYLRGAEVNHTSTVKDFLPSKLPFPLNENDRNMLFCELLEIKLK